MDLTKYYARARNFHFGLVFNAPQQSEERTNLFKHVKKVTLDENAMKDFLERTHYETPPFDHRRYDTVQSEAYRISSSKVLMQELVKKTKFCLNKKCDPSKCGFAHTLEEYNTPTCLQKEFCLDYSCTKNHGFTKEEYMEYHNIKVPVRETLDKTQFCGIMKEYVPCNKKDCKFAHSFWEYKPMKCRFDEMCTDQGCVLLHSRNTIFEYIQNQGVTLKTWMFRSTDMNNSIEYTERETKRLKDEKEFLEKYTEEIKRLEENNWVDDTDLSTALQKLVVEEEEEDDDEIDIVIDGGSISLSWLMKQEEQKYLEKMEKEMEEDYESEDESDGEDSLLPQEEESIMTVAQELGMTFEEVYDMIRSDKKDVVFHWYKNFTCVDV